MLNEKVDNLRGRRFCIERQWKTNSLANRIARAANINMSIITAVKTRKTLTTNLKKKINDSYNYICRQRNCFIYGNQTI
jgi:hypothetical protein